MSLFGNSSGQGNMTGGGLFLQQAQQPSQQLVATSGSSQQAPLLEQQPSWFSNHKKSTIHNHLTSKKKPGFHINNSSKLAEQAGRRSISGSAGSVDALSSANSLVSSKDPFNILSFGSQQRKYLNTSDRSVLFEETVNEADDDAVNQTVGEDVPPSRSIYDLNDDVLLSLSKPKQHVDSFISKDPKNFNNVFNRNEDTTLPISPNSNKTQAATSEPEVNPLTNNLSAILVFGYPEQLASEVIQYFREFGEILEDFEGSKFGTLSQTVASAREHAHKKLAPILSGHGWVKITYDNAASALDALQENGNVFNGVMLGVVAFNKHTVEKIKKRSLTDFEDVGAINFTDLKNKSLKDSGEVNPSENPANTYTARMEIKDGTLLFLQPTDGEFNKDSAKTQNSEKLGVLSSISKYLFGFHEL